MFKKTLLALALGVAAITGASAAASATEYGYVGEGVDYHSGPSPKFYQYGSVDACYEVTIEENSPGDGPKWYRISWGDHYYGWVRADDVSYDRNYCEDYAYDDKKDEYEEKKPVESY
jgi:uncharacterized protein YraI